MKIYLSIIILIEVVVSVQYNQPCTFSSGTCQWSIGRRWHVITLDDGDKVLLADAGSIEDRKAGFTDAIMSPWLHSSALCSHDIRLTFQFSIENVDDHLEVYLIEKNQTRITSLGQWQGGNTSKNGYSIWQRANLTFKAAEEFQIDIEVRHVPEKKNTSFGWFAIDDILVENCPIAIVNTTSRTHLPTKPTITTSTTTPLYSNESHSILSNTSSTSIEDEHASISPNPNFFTLILYLLCALIALTLLIILFSIILFTYRKHCCPSTQDRRNRSKPTNQIGIQIEALDRDTPTTRTIDTNSVRPCFE